MVHSPPVDTAQFPPGEMLDEKYRIDRLISIGGMGAVYLGMHTLLKKAVAIKVLRTELSGAVEMVERFQREAVAASAIGHPNIVDIKDMGKTKGGVAFLVMEYLQGRSLQEAIDEGDAFSVADACDVACEILAAVAAAHRAGIVHRDLKPANVFLVERDDGISGVKLLDFGIAILSDNDQPNHRLTLTGMVLGTPHYMAPEQARGDKEITDAVDIYAAGVILYEMLCKRVPYEADNYNVLIYQVLAGEYAKPSAYRPDLPPELEDIILKAMALKPWDRFAGADDFIAALEPFRSGARATSSVRIQTPGRPRTNRRDEAATSETVSVPADASGDMASDATISSATVAAAAAEFVRMGGHFGDTVPGPLSTTQRVTPRRSPLRLAVPVLGLVVAAGVAFALLGRDDGPAPVAASEPAAPIAPATPEPVPVAPVRVTPDPVTLEFAVTPPEAIVTVDGERVEGGKLTVPAGTTPLAVRIEAEGYEPYEGEIVPERTTELRIPLVKQAPEPDGSRRARRGERARDPRRRPSNRIITEDPYN